MPSAAVLTHRAEHVRWLAHRLEDAAVASLGALAGPDTWRGPLADAFDARWREANRRIAAGADELRALATRLETEARAAALREAAAMP